MKVQELNNWVFNTENYLISYLKILACKKALVKNQKMNENIELKRIGDEISTFFQINEKLALIEDEELKRIYREIFNNEIFTYIPNINVENLINIENKFKTKYKRKESNDTQYKESNILSLFIDVLSEKFRFDKLFTFDSNFDKNIYPENKNLLKTNRILKNVKEWCINSLENINKKTSTKQIKPSKKDYYILSFIEDDKDFDLEKNIEIVETINNCKIYCAQRLVILNKNKANNINYLSYDFEDNFAVFQLTYKDGDTKENPVLMFFNPQNKLNAIKLIIVNVEKNDFIGSFFKCYPELDNLFKINFKGNMAENEYFLNYNEINDNLGIVPENYFNSKTKAVQLKNILRVSHPRNKNLPEFGYVISNISSQNKNIFLSKADSKWQKLNLNEEYYVISKPCILKANSFNKVFYLNPMNRVVYIPKYFENNPINYMPPNRGISITYGVKYNYPKPESIYCQNFVYYTKNNDNNLSYISYKINEYILKLKEINVNNSRRREFISIKNFVNNKRISTNQMVFNTKDETKNINNKKTRIISKKFKISNSEINEYLYMSEVNVLNLHIKMDDLSTQQELNRINLNMSRLLNHTRLLLEWRIQETMKEKEAKESEYRSLVHTLGRPHANVQSWATVLKKFFDQPEIQKAIGDQFESTFQKTIPEVLLEIRNEVFRASKILEMGEGGLNIQNYELKTLPIRDLLELTKAKQVPDNKFSFDIQHDISKPNENQFHHVKANKELWSILLDLILDNANIHAFDTKSEKNKVHIQLTSRLHNVQVQIKNNGKPFPKNFDQKAFVTKYKTHEEIGSGIGGSDIDQIMKFFGDYDWELKLDAEANYPVVFQFSLNYSSFSK
ncbi:MAG: hypothetical protein LAT81_12320 [Oceanicaulis sp.]|nr:hypothetical protein [Oceanicaulis sp.]